MGTFGLGGLHRKSTWLYPVLSPSDLPPGVVDGSVAIVVTTNQGYQYDASVPGWIPLSSGGGSGTRVYNEVLTGVIDDVNTTFTTSVFFTPGTEAVYFNGVRQWPGVGNDYSISESGGIGTGYDTVTFAVAPRTRPGPKSDDRVTVDYTPP